MSGSKKRINLTVGRRLYSSLELQEDVYFAKTVYDRRKEKEIPHEAFWKK